MQLLVDVPVVFPCGGGFSLTDLIRPGDEALVVFSSRCIDGWCQGGQAVPPDRQMHDLSDGVAFVGPRSQAARLDAPVDPENGQLRMDDGKASPTIKPDKTLDMRNDQGSMVISPAGEITVTATVQEAGDIHAAAGEIKIIATPCRGWQSAVNTVAATPGRAVKTDAALRERQAVSTALPSRTMFEDTLGAVAAVPGVTRWRGYENGTNVADANELPPHSICLVVEGGDARAIADAIAVKKTPGCYTYGDVEVLTHDDMGVPG